MRDPVFEGPTLNCIFVCCYVSFAIFFRLCLPKRRTQSVFFWVIALGTFNFVELSTLSTRYFSHDSLDGEPKAGNFENALKSVQFLRDKAKKSVFILQILQSV